MLHYLGNTEHTSFPCAKWEDFTNWILKAGNRELELDVETNVCESILERELITVQFGGRLPQKTQWVLQWSSLDDSQRGFLKALLEHPKFTYFIHNASFEYTILRKQGIVLRQVYDSMLGEKLLYCGIDTPPGFYSLKDTAKRYLNVDLSKAEQTTFGDNILTDDKIQYAAVDVALLLDIRDKQKIRLAKEQLERCLELENQAVLAFGDIEFNGMGLDAQRWLQNVEKAKPLVAQAEAELKDTCLQFEEVRQWLIQEGKYFPAERFTLNWGSPVQKKTLLDQLFAGKLEGITKATLKKTIKAKGWDPETVDNFLGWLYRGEYDKCEAYIMANDVLREMVKGMDFLSPPHHLEVNWGSWQQRLAIFRLQEPDIEDTAEETLSDYLHNPIVEGYVKWNDTHGLVSKFGEKWIEKNLDPDGKVRTRFNQVLKTGRVSSSKPNMQQIPANNDYRNCFTAPDGWVFVSSDYSSQELCLIAFLAKDPVWLGALQEGKDLHSVCAELVYKEKWLKAAEPGCEFYYAWTDKEGNEYPANSKSKCSCKAHKKLRDGVKTINFGLAYGMSAKGLSAKIKSSVGEAQELIDEYFKTFPKIGGMLHSLGVYGCRYGIIKTLPPFGRRRYFDYHYKAVAAAEKGHRNLMGKIERASKNTPIQGSCGDMTKQAMVLVRDYILEHKLEDKVQLVMVVHDQVDTIARKEYAPEWAPILTKLMEDAALYNIPTGILKAETSITERWSK